MLASSSAIGSISRNYTENELTLILKKSLYLAKRKSLTLSELQQAVIIGSAAGGLIGGILGLFLIYSN